MGVREFNNKTQKEFPVHKDKVSLSSDFPSFNFSVLSDDEGHFEPAVKGLDAHSIQTFEGQDATVINDGRMFFEFVLNAPVDFVGFSDLTDSTDDELRGQFVSISYKMVREFMDTDLSECFVLKGKLGDMVAGYVELFHGFQQLIVLLGGREQLGFDC